MVNPLFFYSSLGGYRNISNQYSITTKIDKEHPEMREYARGQGWWDGATPFNFSTVYSFTTTARIEASGSRYCEGKKLLEKNDGLYFTAGNRHAGGKKVTGLFPLLMPVLI